MKGRATSQYPMLWKRLCVKEQPGAHWLGGDSQLEGVRSGAQGGEAEGAAGHP